MRRVENGRVPHCPPLSLKEKVALYLMVTLTVCVAFFGRVATRIFELIYPDFLGVDAELPVATTLALLFGRYSLLIPVLLLLLLPLQRVVQEVRMAGSSMVLGDVYQHGVSLCHGHGGRRLYDPFEAAYTWHLFSLSNRATQA